MLKLDLGARVTDQGPVGRCPTPIAHQVCNQSRMHTLRRYRIMNSLAGPFYYGPQRDVLWLSIDAADEYSTHMPFLEREHYAELNSIETILVLDGEWPESPVEGRRRGHIMDHTLDYISHLGGLKTVQVIWPPTLHGNEFWTRLFGEGHDVDDESEWEDIEVEDVEGKDLEEEKENKQEEEIQQTGALKVANNLRSNFQAVIQYEHCTATKIEVIDRVGNLY